MNKSVVNGLIDLLPSNVTVSVPAVVVIVTPFCPTNVTVSPVESAATVVCPDTAMF